MFSDELKHADQDKINDMALGKTYIHKKHLISDDGAYVEMRCSFDKERFILRSVRILNHEKSCWEPIKNVVLSNKGSNHYD